MLIDNTFKSAKSNIFQYLNSRDFDREWEYWSCHYGGVISSSYRDSIRSCLFDKQFAIKYFI